MISASGSGERLHHRAADALARAGDKNSLA